jgi:quinol monooxygenase YgiN
MVHVTLLVKCQPGKGADLLAAFTTALVDTRNFDGCVSVQTFVDADNPDTVLLVEEWESRDQQEAYLTWRIESGMIEMLAPVLADPFEMRYLEPHPA